MPKTASDWVNEGNLFNKQGNFREAIICYDKALEIDPKYLEAFCCKADLSFHRGNYIVAIKFYNETLAIDPNHKQALWRKTLSFYYQNEFADAITSCNQALIIDPKDKTILVGKGIILFCQENFYDALTNFDKVLMIDSSDIGALQGRAIFCYSEGLTVEADILLAQVDQLLEKITNKSLVAFYLYDRANMFFAMKNFGRANQVFEKVNQLAPEFGPAQERLEHAVNEKEKTLSTYVTVLATNKFANSSQAKIKKKVSFTNFPDRFYQPKIPFTLLNKDTWQLAIQRLNETFPIFFAKQISYDIVDKSFKLTVESVLSDPARTLNKVGRELKDMFGHEISTFTIENQCLRIITKTQTMLLGLLLFFQRVAEVHKENFPQESNLSDYVTASKI